MLLKFSVGRIDRIDLGSASIGNPSDQSFALIFLSYQRAREFSNLSEGFLTTKPDLVQVPGTRMRQLQIHRRRKRSFLR
jgi:hypothetical protein